MQKQAYNIHFHPVPIPTSGDPYFDTAPTPLPYTESISTLHYHDKYEIGICEGGEGLFLSEGAFSSVSRGDIIFIPPNKRHYSRSFTKDAPCLCRFVHPKAHKIRDLILHLTGSEEETTAILSVTNNHIPPIIHPSDYPEEAAILSDLVASCHVGAMHLSETVELRLALFLLEAHHSFAPRAEGVPSVSQTDAAVATVVSYLSVHYDASDTVTDLARLVHLSESQLRRRFLSVYGMPPIAYRNHLRTAIAKELLAHTTLSIAEISQRVGYGDVCDLYRAFIKNLGQSPSGFRASLNRKIDPFLLNQKLQP